MCIRDSDSGAEGNPDDGDGEGKPDEGGGGGPDPGGCWYPCGGPWYPNPNCPSRLRAIAASSSTECTAAALPHCGHTAPTWP